MESDWLFSGRKLKALMKGCMSSNKIKASLICNLLNANSKVFYKKQFMQNQCQNTLTCILLSFQLRFFGKISWHKTSSPEISSSKRGIF